ncbi:hypothetical protein ACM6Q7_26515 [Peribacillus butanolivorans]|uniref:hypothetical protein n=1 Tax=Peribacillus butanolivorans TaxID=421767 RepID=UPI0039FC9BEE
MRAWDTFIISRGLFCALTALSVLVLLGVFHWFFSSSPTKELSTSNIVDIEKEREVTNADEYGSVGYGLKNLKGKHIDEGSTLNSKDNEMSVVASVDHYIDEDRKYALLVFEDYKQVKFKVENKEQEVNKYFFEMKPNSSINFKVSVPIRSDSIELTFVIVQKPEYKLKELDLILFLQKLDIFLILNYLKLKAKKISNSSPFHFLMK